MPKKKHSEKQQKYTKIFSNIEDDRDPYEELKMLRKGKSIKHALNDFEFGLFDIKNSKYDMRQFVKRYPYIRNLLH